MYKLYNLPKYLVLSTYLKNVSLINIFFSVAGGLPLNEFIRHFEPAFYQPIILDVPGLKSDSGRQKRSLTHHDDSTVDSPDVDDFDISYHAKPISFNVTAHNRYVLCI